jgi:hypothetical protein
MQGLPDSTSHKNHGPVDLARLFKLRLVVARFGEMDLLQWWNTQGMLGSRGAIVLRRGFPTTHYFAQARVVFAVARSRCAELFSPPKCMTLWDLPAELEDQFEEQWQTWLDELDSWTPLFERLAAQKDGDLLAFLERIELLLPTHREAVAKLRRSAENRAVPLPGAHEPTDEILTLLAAGFARGERGAPAIPYARLAD